MTGTLESQAQPSTLFRFLGFGFSQCGGCLDSLLQECNNCFHYPAGADVMAQGVKCLPCKHEDPCSDPQHPHEKAGLAAHSN